MRNWGRNTAWERKKLHIVKYYAVEMARRRGSPINSDERRGNRKDRPAKEFGYLGRKLKQS